MFAVKAIYDGINFKPKHPIPVSGTYEVIITFVEPANSSAVRPPFKYGSMSGKIRMSADFDAPLDDFKEYM